MADEIKWSMTRFDMSKKHREYGIKANDKAHLFHIKTAKQN